MEMVLCSDFYREAFLLSGLLAMTPKHPTLLLGGALLLLAALTFLVLEFEQRERRARERSHGEAFLHPKRHFLLSVLATGALIGGIALALYALI